MRILRLTKAMGWTLDQWRALPPHEQELRLAYELRRDNDLDDVIKMLQEKKTTASGTETSAWEPAAAAVLLSAKIG